MVGATLVRLRWTLFAIGLATLAIALPASNRLQLDRSITSMFSTDDPVRTDYERLQASFGGNVVVMFVYRDPDLLTKDGIARNQRLTDQVAALPGVRGVLSPAKLNQVVSQIRPTAQLGLGAQDSRPWIARKEDPLSEGFLDLFQGYTHQQEEAAAAVVAMLEPDYPASTIDQLQSIVDQASDVIEDPVIVGEPVLIHDGFTLIQRDGTKLATWTIAGLSLVIVLVLRSIRMTLLVVVCIAWAVIITRALVVALGMELSIVSTILTAIATVIVVASILHLGVMDQRQSQDIFAEGISLSNRKTSAVRTLQALWVPITWTCLTDAAGFLALMLSSIRPVRDFGVMIGIAAIAALVSVMLFAPVFLSGSLGFRHRHSKGLVGQQVSNLLTKWVQGCVAWRHAVLMIAAALAVVCVWGVQRTETETSFLKNFRQESRLAQAYGQVEARLGGAGVWDVILPAPNQLTVAYLDSVRGLQQQLRQLKVEGESLTKVISMADAEQVAARVPLLALGPPEVRMQAMRVVLPAFCDALLTPIGRETREFRIMIRSREQLNAQSKNGLIDAVRSVVRDHVSTDTWQGLVEPGSTERNTVTGYYVMLAALVDHLVADQWLCFALSFVLVLMLLWRMSRSLTLALAATTLNLLPALFVLAAIGWLGGKLNLGAAMIAAVSIGLSIDGSVHFLHQHRNLVRAGHSWVDAAIVAGSNVGVPMMWSMLALVIGFGILANSEFLPTATFGVLVAWTLVLGTLVNLTLLPAAVVLLQPQARSPGNKNEQIPSGT